MYKEQVAKRKEILTAIHRNKHMLDFNQRKTLIGQTKSGDFEGATKGLKRLIREATGR